MEFSDAFDAELLDIVVVAVGRTMIDAVVDLEPDVVVVEHDAATSGIVRICTQLAASLTCRILVAAVGTVQTADDVVIAVLDAGADDYLAAPTSCAVLQARLRVALRAAPVERSPRTIVVGDVIVDGQAHLVHIAGETVEMPPVRFELLASLARRVNAIVRYDTLLAEVWGDRSTSAHPHRLRSAVSLLRSALGEGPGRPTIENVAHVGYRLVVASHRGGDARVDSVA